MASLHLIDPDGDVELLLHQEVEPLVHEDITITPSPSDLEYRRDIAPEVKESKKKKKKGRSPAFAWNPEPEPEPEPQPQPERELEQGSEQSQAEETLTDRDTDNMRFRIRVSSKHLMLASSYFKRSLGGK